MQQIYCKFYLLLLAGCCYCLPLQAQVSYGMDTTLHMDSDCGKNVSPFWWAKGKYPESSGRLVRMANTALGTVPDDPDANGFIVYYLLISCKGVPASIRLSQMDRYYQPRQFSKKLVEGLAGFVRGLPS